MSYYSFPEYDGRLHPVELMDRIVLSENQGISVSVLRENPGKEVCMYFDGRILPPIGHPIPLYMEDVCIGDITIIQHYFMPRDGKVVTRVRGAFVVLD